MLTNFIIEDEGATAIEYGLIASLVAVFLILSLGLLGNALSSTFSSVAAHL